MPYCTSSGSSRLYCSRMLCRYFSEMRCPPTMILAGSPGTKRTMKKTTLVIRNISGISVSRRVTIRRVIAIPVPGGGLAPDQ